MSPLNTEKMTAFERKIALLLASIYASRMLGLFMIVPVFALYAENLVGYSMTLVGVAIGIYGLTQAVLQIPLGLLSDRVGRKPVIIAGLTVFAIGSAVAAMSTDIYGVIIGRALQGAGAIASAVMALAADLTREEHRTKVMASIGLSIGMVFGLAFIIGPIFHGWFGVNGIFWITALLALISIAITYFLVPDPVSCRFHRETEVEVEWFSQALRDRELLRLDAGAFVLHYIMVSSFVVLPVLIRDQLGMDVHHHWKLYLPVMLFSVLAMVPFIVYAERNRKLKPVLLGAVITLALAQLAVPFASDTMAGVAIVLWLFFTAFNLLEASLPSLVSRMAPAAHKGTAMGAYSTSQFLGVFLGGLGGGWLSQHFGLAGVAVFNVTLVIAWASLVMTMRPPHYHSSYLLNVGDLDEPAARHLVKELAAIQGVVEATVIARDGMAYLKVDKAILDTDSLQKFAAV